MNKIIIEELIQHFDQQLSTCNNTGISLLEYRCQLPSETPKKQAGLYYIFKSKLVNFIKTKYDSELIIDNPRRRGTLLDNTQDIARVALWSNSESLPTSITVGSSPVSPKRKSIDLGYLFADDIDIQIGSEFGSRVVSIEDFLMSC